MKYVMGLCLVVLLYSCQHEKLYNDLGQLSGDGVIAINSNNVSGDIGEIFSKYTYVTAPNQGRIEIFGTSGVSDEQMIYARDILKQYLTIDGDKYKKVHKDFIANSMANKKSALVFFDTEEQAEANISKIGNEGYNVQDLYASESINSGNRDASYEEILHLTHNYGITPVLFEFQDQLQKANDDAIAKGLYKPADELPKADRDDEYFAAIMDCYLGLWEGQGTTMGGEYQPSNKTELKEQDPKGYALIRALFGDIKTVR